MSMTFSLATINTQAGKLLEQLDGLSPFARDHIDILLLQEVFGASKAIVTHRMEQSGYRLVAFDRSTGLAIATYKDSNLSVADGSGQSTLTKPKGRLASAFTDCHIVPEHQLRAYGFLTMQVRTSSNQTLVVATTHPAVFIRARSRQKHLDSFQRYLCDTYDFSQPLIVGADMNHYPGPGRNDIAFRQLGHFNEVPVDGVTWFVEGTKYEGLARTVSAVVGWPLHAFNGRLDAILYRGDDLCHTRTQTVAIESDHRAIISYFTLKNV